MNAIARLQILQMLNGRNIWLLALFLVAPVLLTGAVNAGGRFSGDDPEFAASTYLFLVFPFAMCMLMALVYGTSIIGTDFDWKTLTYLFTRPIPKWKIVLVKYVAVVATILLPTVVSAVVCWGLIGAPGGASVLLALVLTVVYALITYTAIFASIGLLVPKHPVPIGLAYIVIVEVALSFVPAVVNYLTVTYYLRSLAVKIVHLEIPPDVQRIWGANSTAAAVLAPFAFTAGALALTMWLTSTRQFTEAPDQL